MRHSAFRTPRSAFDLPPLLTALHALQLVHELLDRQVHFDVGADRSKRLFLEAGIPTPPWVAFTSGAFKEMGAASALDLVPGAVGGFPVCVKPTKQGSALGLSKVADAAGLPDALLTALSFGEAAMVEGWIEGRELAVSVLGEPGDTKVLPPVEMVPKDGIFDFDAMYTQGETEYYCPARLAPEVLREVEELARGRARELQRAPLRGRRALRPLL